jgi:hypothetical protein
MAVGSTTNHANRAYHNQRCEFKAQSWRGVLDTTLCDKVCQWFAAGPWFLETWEPISSTASKVLNNWKVSMFYVFMRLKRICLWCLTSLSTIFQLYGGFC